MQIVYNAKHNKDSDNTEGHIRCAIEKLGHTIGDTGDIYLYHKRYCPPDNFKGKSVMWFFDKVIFQERERKVKDLMDKADYIFLTDGSYGRGMILRQGFGEEDLFTGCKDLKLKEKIGFIGSIYGNRTQFAQELSTEFSKDFGCFSGFHEAMLQRLIQSLKIVVAPEYPSEDYYWSNRVYLTLGYGGFLLHPRIKGIEDEYVDGKHLVLYDDTKDLIKKIKYYLKHPKEAKAIAEEGQRKTLKDYTYTKRVKHLLDYVKKDLRN